jgi:hypothetical protein
VPQAEVIKPHKASSSLIPKKQPSQPQEFAITDTELKLDLFGWCDAYSSKECWRIFLWLITIRWLPHFSGYRAVVGNTNKHPGRD